MGELETLIRQRATIKGKLTRLNTFFENVNSDTIDELIFNQLTLRLNLGENLLFEFNETQNKIESLSLAEIIGTDEDSNSKKSRILEISDLERLNFEDKFFSIISLIKTYLSKYAPDTQSQHSATSNSPNAQSSGRVRLPNINLPTFTGRYNEWSQFHDTFKGLIDSDSSLIGIPK